MRQVSLLFVLLVFCTFTNAQEFALGLKAGLNYYSIGDINSIGGSIELGKPDELFSPNKEIGTQFGVYVNVEFGKLFIRPELNYVLSKNNYAFPKRASVWKSSKIEIPIVIGYQLFKPISFYAGPSLNILNKINLDGVQVTSYSDGGPDLKKTTFSLNFGIMGRYGRFGLDLRYEYSLAETEEERLDIVKSQYGVNLVDLKPYRPNIFSLSIFYDIVRTNGDDFDGLFSNLFKKKCYCPY